MSGSEGGGVPSPRVPLGLSLEQARELERGHVIQQLQQNYQTLSTEVTQLATELREVLNHLREDPGGGRRHSRHQRDDKKFDASKFNGSLNLDSYLKWVQSIKRFFHVKEHSGEKVVRKYRARDGKFKIRTWTKLKKLMDKWFLVGTCNQKPH